MNAPVKAPMKIKRDGLRDPNAVAAPQPTLRDAFAVNPRAHPPKAVPEGAKMALDDTSNLGSFSNWAGSFYASAYLEGQQFLGYATLAAMSQRAEYRVMVETIATEMTRKWVELKAKSEDEDKSEKIREITEEMERLHVREVFKKLAEIDGYFGRAHLYVDTGDLHNPGELKTSIGDGADETSRAKIQRGTIKGFKAIEPVWVYPSDYNSDDPLAANWYRPARWFVMGKELHGSRLITYCAREVSDMLKPAYSFGGLALTQMAKPYVDNWLRTRQSVADIINSFVTWVLKTNLTATLAGGMTEDLYDRAQLFNELRSNKGLMMLDKDAEEFVNVSAPLGSLDHLQAQAQEQMASVSRIPLVKLTGISPSGLNACLTGETLILTDRGQVPIRDVMVSDKVMTRRGFAKLTFSGATKYATELIEIRTQDAVIRCTPNHPIWLPSINEFVAAENVRNGDRLLSIGGKNVVQNTPLPSRGGDVGGGETNPATTRLSTQEQNAPFFYTAQCGRHIEGLFRADFISTIATAIRKTINSAIWKLCERRITPRITALTSASALVFMRLPRSWSFAPIAVGSSGSRNFQASESFAAKNAFSRTGEKNDHLRQNLSRSASAGLAESLSSLIEGMQNSVLASALLRAKTALDTCAATISRTPKNGEIISIKRIPAGEMVYDLTVERGCLPEFFANGILVHNSSEGEIKIWYDFIRAEQEAHFAGPLRRVINFIQLSLYGEVDDEITFQFRPLDEMTEDQAATIRKTEADTDAVLIQEGVLSPAEVRKRVANDVDSPYAGIDVDDLPDPPAPEGGGEGGPGAPGGPMGEAGPGGQPEGTDDMIDPWIGALAAAFGKSGAQDDGVTRDDWAKAFVIAPAAGGRDAGARDPWRVVFKGASDEWKEGDHPRGQPGNAGQFGSGGGGGGKNGGGKAKEAAKGGGKESKGEASGGEKKAAPAAPAETKSEGGGAAASAKASTGSAGGKEKSGGEGSGGSGEASHGSPASALYAKFSASVPRTREAQIAKGAEIAERLGASKLVADARAKAAESIPTSASVSEGGFLDDKTGEWTPERAALHEKLIDELLSAEAVQRATPMDGAKPTMTILGGRGGSGKSWLTSKSGPVDAEANLVIDADHFKTALPEYQGYNAAALHEESSYLADRCAAIAAKLGLNVVLDITMKSSSTAASRINQFVDAGHDVHGFYMFASPETATERAVGRFKSGMEKTGKGRFVPPEIIMGNVDNEKPFDNNIPFFKKWGVYDNNEGGGRGPRHVAGSDLND